MTPAVLMLFTIFALGIFLVFYGVSQWCCGQRRLLTVFINKNETQSFLYGLQKNHSIASFKELIENQADFSGTGWTFVLFLIYSALCGAVGFFIGVHYLQNFAAAIPLAWGFGMTPWGYMAYFTVKKRRLLEQQLMPVIQCFIAEYRALPNVISSLNSILPKVDYPLREELDLLVRGFNSGRPRETALFSFARRLNSPWAYRFAHILNLRLSRGLNINGMLYNLYMEMKTQLIKEQERRMETIGVRLESYLLYLFIPVMYFLASKINPQAHYLLTKTGEGQKAMFLIIILLVIGIMSTIKLSNNRIT